MKINYSIKKFAVTRELVIQWLGELGIALYSKSAAGDGYLYKGDKIRHQIVIEDKGIRYLFRNIRAYNNFISKQDFLDFIMKDSNWIG